MIAGSALRPRHGERVSGDAVVVRRDGKRLLFAVIDALGHGEHAHHAAELAVRELTRCELDLSAAELMKRVHAALRGSRGAAITLGVCQGSTIELVGVGNVELRCGRCYIPFAPTPGIVGLRIRKLRVVRSELPKNARLFLFSDGISSRLDPETVAHLRAEEAAAALLACYGNANDDASVLCLFLDSELHARG
ncbi:MAG TPA: SpoIIE family protein phosphatase [Polyangiaceae bacterium]|nr:SpoIIE family protein phosphatase [Polyangiaceae bacterium]